MKARPPNDAGEIAEARRQKEEEKALIQLNALAKQIRKVATLQNQMKFHPSSEIKTTLNELRAVLKEKKYT
jgi:hypothetical protein